MGAHRAEQSAVISADPQTCFEAVCDFETYPEWQSAVKRCDVLERGADGRGSLIETVIDAKLKRVRYVLRYHYDAPARIWWDYVEGDVKSIDGDYEFEDLGDGGTRAIYRLAIDPGRFLPGPLRKILTDQVMKTSVKELKTRVEDA